MQGTAYWSARSIYLYLVCLIMLIMAVVALVEVVRNVAELAYPQPSQSAYPVKPIAAPGETSPQPTAEELAAQRDFDRQWSWRNAILGIIRNLAMLIVAGPVYLYHWRKIERTPREA
ncbi:MAG: hypothetical protein V1772_10160 [Chloroflexota bacterium]